LEFVAFLQNNNTKEILQGMKVPAVFLPPPPVAPVADFEADATQSCEGYEVQFTDLSSGTPTQWSWSFPGGTPDASTEQNPVVVYADEGVYDVSLEASNSAGSSDILKEDYMTISFTPEKPTITEIDFTLNSSATDGNQWFLDGDSIVGATSQSFVPLSNGTYTVTVTQGNCISESSEGHEILWVGIQEQIAGQSLKKMFNSVSTQMLLSLAIRKNFDSFGIAGLTIKKSTFEKSSSKCLPSLSLTGKPSSNFKGCDNSLAFFKSIDSNIVLPFIFH
jgi:hypothetical protein